MKLTIKVVLFVCVLSSVTFADGEMGTSGKSCTANCLAASRPTEKETVKTEPENSILTFVQKYLISIFG